MSHVKQPAKAIILDCEGPVLTQEEQALFRDLNPYGFILFQRNCETPSQLRKLTDQLRLAVGREDCPILIDQEGGAVARLRKPAFTEFPPALFFKEMAENDIKAAEAAVYQNAIEMAEQLAGLGITVNCTPVLDIPVKGSHEFLAKNRVYGEDADTVSRLGDEICKGHLGAGVTPVIKHIPGHGRATMDSHFDLPRITANLAELRGQDFKPFAELSRSAYGAGLWAMTAHVIYEDIDPDRPGSLSEKVISEIIRQEIGFDGVLIADDISMKALQGRMEDHAAESLKAGCDLTLLCNQDFETRRKVLENTDVLTDKAISRLAKAEEFRKTSSAAALSLI